MSILKKSQLNSILFISLLISSALAQANPQESIKLITAAYLLDVNTGKLLKNPQVLVKGERIIEVGQALHAPENAERIDVGEYILLPGLIDAHVHIAAGGATLGNTPGTARIALRSAHNARLTLHKGFTSVRSMGGPAYTGVALRDAINSGDVIGPRIYDAGAILSVTGGHCSGQRSSPDAIVESRNVANNPDEFRQKVREVFKYGADFVKICITGGFVSGTDATITQFTEEEVRAVIETAHQLGKKVAVHAHATEGVKLALRAGADSIEHASLIDDEGIKLFKKARHAVLVPTLSVYGTALQRAEAVGVTPYTRKKLEYVLGVYEKNVAKAVNSGIPIVYGTDGPPGHNSSEFSLLLRVGLTPLQAVQAATIHAAALLDANSDIGAIEAGKYADIIAVRHNPLEDIKTLDNIPWVLKGGVVYKDEREQAKVLLPR